VGIFGLNGQRVQTFVNEILHGIIHKAVADHPRFAAKQGRGNAHPKVGAEAGLIGADVTRVLMAFVNHLEFGGGQPLL